MGRGAKDKKGAKGLGETPPPPRAQNSQPSQGGGLFGDDYYQEPTVEGGLKIQKERFEEELQRQAEDAPARRQAYQEATVEGGGNAHMRGDAQKEDDWYRESLAQLASDESNDGLVVTSAKNMRDSLYEKDNASEANSDKKRRAFLRDPDGRIKKPLRRAAVAVAGTTAAVGGVAGIAAISPAVAGIIGVVGVGALLAAAYGAYYYGVSSFLYKSRRWQDTSKMPQPTVIKKEHNAEEYYIKEKE